MRAISRKCRESNSVPTPGTRKLPCCTEIGRGCDQCGKSNDQVPARPTCVQCQHGSGPGCRTFLEKRTQSLRPLESKWEKFIAILDSGASVTVVPPHIGHDYETTRGEAAIAGVRYEIADGNEIPNLGEKLLPIMTREGTWRSLKAEVADISRALQSVRSLVKTGHRVVFGGGDDGNFH